MEKVILTIFTDPMMGLSYECEPIFDRLKNEYGDGLEIRYVIAGLDEKAFLRSFHDGSAEAAFQKDLRFTRFLGICSLPSYLLQ
ncbi:MAG: hypothetical protein IJJ85_12285 [Clostridia bacterium]|nr:hypothetical protein [Clostridia bacterium]